MSLVLDVMCSEGTDINIYASWSRQLLVIQKHLAILVGERVFWDNQNTARDDSSENKKA